MIKICGPKLSLCCTILSIWGIIQLLLMGIFFYTQAVALAEDLPINKTAIQSREQFFKAVDDAYELNAYNCWIAAGLYVITLVLSVHQFWMNSRQTA